MTGVRWKGYIATARDAERWAERWAEFFHGAKRALDEDVERFILEQEKAKYLKQSLQRLEARKFIQHKNGAYIPTRKGAFYFKRKKLLADQKRNAKENKTWDGKYRLVSFDVPGGYSNERDTLRGLLGEFSFYPLQKSVWVSPDYLPNEFWELLVEQGLHKYCSVMLVDILEGDQKLKEHFFSNRK